MGPTTLLLKSHEKNDVDEEDDDDDALGQDVLVNVKDIKGRAGKKLAKAQLDERNIAFDEDDSIKTLRELLRLGLQAAGANPQKFHPLSRKIARACRNGELNYIGNQ